MLYMGDMYTKLFHMSTQISWLDVFYIPPVPVSASQMDIKNFNADLISDFIICPHVSVKQLTYQLQNTEQNRHFFG